MNTAAILLTIFLMAVMGPVVTLLSLPPASHGLVLVMAPPWIDREAAIARAGGNGVGPVAAHLASLAQSDDPEFGDRLRAAGPFLVVDGQAVASLCGVQT